MFILFISHAAILEILSFKSTVIKIIIIVVIIYYVGVFLWELNPPVFLLLCQVTFLLLIKLVGVLLPNTAHLSTVDLDVVTSSVQTLLLWFPICILGMLIVFSLVCFVGINGWGSWFIVWCYGHNHKGLCSDMFLFRLGACYVCRHGHMFHMLFELVYFCS